MITWISNKIDYKKTSDNPPPRDLWNFIIWSCSGTWTFIFFGACAAVLAGSFEMITTIALGWVVDAAQSDNSQAFFFSSNKILLIICVLIFLIFRPLSFCLSALFQAVLGPKILNMTLLKLHRWTLGQSISFFENDFAGRIAQKQLQTANSLSTIITDILQTGVYSLASVIAAMLVVGSFDLASTVFVALWLTTYLYLIKIYMPRIRIKSKAYADAKATVSGQVIDTISNIKTVKQFAHISHENDAAVSAMDKYLDQSLERQKTMLEFRIVLLTLAGLIPIGLVGLSLLSWVNDNATVGQVTVAGAIGLRLAQMTGWVSFTLMNIYAQIGEVEDGIKTLTPKYELTDKKSAHNLVMVEPKIKIENLKFKYGREIGGITDLSLNVAAGEKIGLVGASGAGKSTLVNLILRFYDPESGTVSISDQNIAEVTQDSLRKEISMVAQDTSMFNRSAYENILYGNPLASREDVLNAAKKAQAHHFINELSDNQGRKGFEAHLGERGVKLSGGQRQRIALARAILKNAPILILDEATSALDSETEAQIQEALDYVMRKKTVIAIAHRLSTIVKMDRIILLHEGKIAEQGTHNDLLAFGGLYCKYWERQSGGFIGIDRIAV